MAKASDVIQKGSIEPTIDKLVLLREQLREQLLKSKVVVGTVIVSRESNRQVVYTEDGKFRPVTLKSEAHIDLSNPDIDKVESIISANLIVNYNIMFQMDAEVRERKRN